MTSQKGIKHTMHHIDNCLVCGAKRYWERNIVGYGIRPVQVEDHRKGIDTVPVTKLGQTIPMLEQY